MGNNCGAFFLRERRRLRLVEYMPTSALVRSGFTNLVLLNELFICGLSFNS